MTAKSMKDFAARDRRDLIEDCDRPYKLKTPDAEWPLKVQRAMDFLGPRWRGRADCSHRYTNSYGDEVTPEYLLEKNWKTPENLRR